VSVPVNRFAQQVLIHRCRTRIKITKADLSSSTALTMLRSLLSSLARR